IKFSTFLGQIELVPRRLLLLLDETVEQNNFFVHHGEQRSRNAILQPRTNFPNAVAQIVHQRLPDGPCVLNGQNVSADGLALFFRQTFEPVADWFVARLGLEEDHLERAFGFHSQITVSKMIQMSNGATAWSRRDLSFRG